MIKQAVLSVVVVAASLGALAAFGSFPNPFHSNTPAVDNRVDPNSPQPPKVSVTKADGGPAQEKFVLPGTTQAIQDAPLFARVNGYLRTRYVDIGDTVHTGQLLAEIDTPELDKRVQSAASAVEQSDAALDAARQAFKKAQADANAAKANLDKAKTDLDYYTAELRRYQLLAQQGVVSIEDRDLRLQAYNGGTANLEALQASLSAAEANIHSAEAAVHVSAAALESAKATCRQYDATRSFKKVVAPFDGVITRSDLDPGALITSGSSNTNTMIFDLAKTDVLRVLVSVPEQYVDAVRNREKVSLTFEEYPNETFDAFINNFSGGIDPNSKTLQIEIHALNHDKKLMPGMYAQAHFEVPNIARVAIIPSASVRTEANGTFAYEIDPQNRVHIRTVELGRDLGNRFEIIRNVNIGDTVIVNPPDGLQEGMVVAPTALPKEKEG